MGAGHAGMGEREGGPRIPLVILVSGPCSTAQVVVRGRVMGVSLSDSHTSVCVVCSARNRLSEPQQRYEMMRRAEWLCALALAWPAPRRESGATERLCICQNVLLITLRQ